MQGSSAASSLTGTGAVSMVAYTDATGSLMITFWEHPISKSINRTANVKSVFMIYLSLIWNLKKSRYKTKSYSGFFINLIQRLKVKFGAHSKSL
jgi:hypothetical protein